MRCSSNVLHTLISSNDLADRLGVSRATVVRAVARGRLRPALVTPGGHRRFLPQEVEGLQPGLSAEAPALVGSAEAARILGVSQQTLNRAVRLGRLTPTAVTPGGHRRFAVSELEAWRRARACGETPT
jgi:excisionase family DNA binding protein